ncbi:hypothetical protein ADM98_01760 [Exiguobacterium sp. BMC-KP]|uniref:hypothetical protein n=1 Tax=Exiguobacterium sp. BMC-KP TaxID=1684312 RepID=UPI0006AA4475|nr:hypothetical protein [Exiguobacterium sp. BMC-KP]KOP31160.1 hypothetical protein ADM98_01760 [Exiguobacterium sp. BMC-KP]
MDKISITVAIISAAISMYVGIIQHIREKKINQTNLESIYFNDIYKEFLIKKIPEARKYIHVKNDGSVIGIEKMIEELNTIRQDSLYYHYNDSKFFEKLKSDLQDLEDYLINKSNKKLSSEEHSEFYENVKIKLMKIYKTINNKFLGTK